jgi:hypothetical protein
VWIELAHGVAFPDVARPTQAVTPASPPEIIIGKDDLIRLPQRIAEVFAYCRQSWTRDFERGQLIVGELVKLLARSVQLRNPLAVDAEAEYQEMIDLTGAQIRTLALLQRVRRAELPGSAGCGKTFLAVAKARVLAEQGFRTLLTCYTRPLEQFLRSLTRQTANLQVLSLHALARHLVPDLPAVSSPAEADRRYPARVFDAVTRQGSRPFDAIIVDEGQDVSADWWTALEGCLAEGKDSVLYVFHDSHQTLFRHTGEMPRDLVSIPLEENVRNTQAICRELARHYKGDVRIQPRGPVGRKVVRHTYTSPGDLTRRLGDTLHQLRTTEQFSNRDLVVLTPRPTLAQSSLPGLPLAHGLRLIPAEPRGKGTDIQVSTVADFKGLERAVILVAEIDEQLPAAQQDRDALLYVAFSRPRHHLVVFCTPGAVRAYHLPG